MRFAVLCLVSLERVCALITSLSNLDHLYGSALSTPTSIIFSLHPRKSLTSLLFIRSSVLFPFGTDSFGILITMLCECFNVMHNYTINWHITIL